MKLKHRLRLLHWLLFGVASDYLLVALREINPKRAWTRYRWYKQSIAECLFCKKNFNFCFSEGKSTDWIEKGKRVGFCGPCTERVNGKSKENMLPTAD